MREFIEKFIGLFKEYWEEISPENIETLRD